MGQQYNRYGAPNEGTPSRLLWFSNSPFKAADGGTEDLEEMMIAAAMLKQTVEKTKDLFSDQKG